MKKILLYVQYLYFLSQLLNSDEQFKLTVLQTDKSYSAPVWQCGENKVHIQVYTADFLLIVTTGFMTWVKDLL